MINRRTALSLPAALAAGLLTGTAKAHQTNRSDDGGKTRDWVPGQFLIVEGVSLPVACAVFSPRSDSPGSYHELSDVPQPILNLLTRGTEFRFRYSGSKSKRLGRAVSHHWRDGMLCVIVRQTGWERDSNGHVAHV